MKKLSYILPCLLLGVLLASFKAYNVVPQNSLLEDTPEAIKTAFTEVYGDATTFKKQFVATITENLSVELTSLLSIQQNTNELDAKAALKILTTRLEDSLNFLVDMTILTRSDSEELLNIFKLKSERVLQNYNLYITAHDAQVVDEERV